MEYLLNLVKEHMESQQKKLIASLQAEVNAAEIEAEFAASEYKRICDVFRESLRKDPPKEFETIQYIVQHPNLFDTCEVDVVGCVWLFGGMVKVQVTLSEEQRSLAKEVVVCLTKNLAAIERWRMARGALWNEQDNQRLINRALSIKE